MAKANIKLFKRIIFLIFLTIISENDATSLRESFTSSVIKNQLNQWTDTQKEVNTIHIIRRQEAAEQNDDELQRKDQKLNEHAKNDKSDCTNNKNNSNSNSNCVDQLQNSESITKTTSSILLPAEGATTKTRNLPIEKSYDINDDVVQTKPTIVITTTSSKSNNNKEHGKNKDVSYDDDHNDVSLHTLANYEHADDEVFGNDRNLLKREKRQLLPKDNNWFIAPHTKWCGKGNTADGKYNTLGGASSADKCCRKHDHCKHFIPGLANRYEMFNYRPYTLSHCSCDRRFRTCLKLAQDEDATTIGKLFFNIIQTECFTFKVEKTCKQRDESGNCQSETVRRTAVLHQNRRF